MTNTQIWDAVCKTDPAMTKKVTQRGGFTAIDSYYTIRRLTEQFGAIGKGWGGDVSYQFQDGLVVCTASFWYRDGVERYVSPAILTSNEMIKTAEGGKRFIDEDAGKKALTDAITKWASYLGFSADVFEGKFDDNRYVQEMNRLFHPEPEKPAAQPERKPAFDNEAARITFVTQISNSLSRAQTVADVNDIVSKDGAKLRALLNSPDPEEVKQGKRLQGEKDDALRIAEAAEKGKQKPAQPKTVASAMQPIRQTSVEEDEIPWQ